MISMPSTLTNSPPRSNAAVTVGLVSHDPTISMVCYGDLAYGIENCSRHVFTVHMPFAGLIPSTFLWTSASTDSFLINVRTNGVEIVTVVLQSGESLASLRLKLRGGVNTVEVSAPSSLSDCSLELSMLFLYPVLVLIYLTLKLKLKMRVQLQEVLLGPVTNLPLYLLKLLIEWRFSFYQENI